MKYTVLSIDPGSNSLGYAFSEINGQSMIVRAYESLAPSAYPKGSDYRKHNKYYPDRILTGKIISRTIKDLVHTYNPDYLACEDAFYNPSRPNAFISLLIAIYAMESALYRLYSDGELKDPMTARLYKTPPTLIKKVMNHDLGGKATKIDMMDALTHRVQEGAISFSGYPSRKLPDASTFTEHSVDAISIGYTFSKLWKPILEANILEPRMNAFTKTVSKLLKKKKYQSPYLK